MTDMQPSRLPILEPGNGENDCPVPAPITMRLSPTARSTEEPTSTFVESGWQRPRASHGPPFQKEKAGEAGPPAGRNLPRRRRHAVLALGLTLLLPAAGYGGYRWWDYTRTWVTTDNASLSGHVLTVSSRVAGTVSEVLVEDNQEVQAGKVLARLDPNDLKVQREKAAATLAQAEAQVAQARAQVLRDTALAGKAKLDLDRAEKLFRDRNGVISEQEFDTSKAAWEAANAALNASQALQVAAEAQVMAATAQVKDVDLQLSYTEIVAPAAGRVGRKNVELGNRVQPGQALLAIVEPKVWVTANFKETQLQHLRPCQKVKLEVDTFPGRDFMGEVESLAPASGAQFALLPPDNATGNFTKIVQRVPVKIVFDPESTREFASRLVPGMSVTVKVRVRGT